MLHLNKQININDTNFEEISIPSKKRYSTVSIKQQQYPQQSQFQTPKTIVHLLYNLLDHHLYVVMDR